MGREKGAGSVKDLETVALYIGALTSRLLAPTSVCLTLFSSDWSLSVCISVVEKVANESQKTPRDVVMMENFHHIFSTLSSLKISCLEAERKEAKQKYTEHLQSYVINSLGQPLEKLNVSQIFMETRIEQYYSRTALPKPVQ